MIKFWYGTTATLDIRWKSQVALPFVYHSHARHPLKLCWLPPLQERDVWRGYWNQMLMWEVGGGWGVRFGAQEHQPCPNPKACNRCLLPTTSQQSRDASSHLNSISYVNIGIGQNHIYKVYIRYFWQGNHQLSGQIRCMYIRLWPTPSQYVTRLGRGIWKGWNQHHFCS